MDVIVTSGKEDHVVTNVLAANLLTINRLVAMTSRFFCRRSGTQPGSRRRRTI